MATFVGTLLSDLGLVPLAAHLFIFYFGMMSMVTPPVALAAYTAAAIAKADVMRSCFAAFRFSLIGFVLPYAFVLDPSLLLSTKEKTCTAYHLVATANCYPPDAGVTHHKSHPQPILSFAILANSN